MLFESVLSAQDEKIDELTRGRINNASCVTVVYCRYLERLSGISLPSRLISTKLPCPFLDRVTLGIHGPWKIIICQALGWIGKE